MNPKAFSADRAASAISQTMSSSDVDSYNSSSSSDFTDVSSLSSPYSGADDKEITTTLQLQRTNEAALTHSTNTRRYANNAVKTKPADPNERKLSTTAAGRGSKQTQGLPRDRDTKMTATSSQQASARGEQEDHDLRLLAAALGSLEASQNSRKLLCHSPNAPRPRTPNHTFPPEQVREIARENLNLLGRLHRTHTRPMRTASVNPPGPREASAAINRRHLQRQIQRENLILLRKITAARGINRKRPSHGLRETYSNPL